MKKNLKLYSLISLTIIIVLAMGFFSKRNNFSSPVASQQIDTTYPSVFTLDDQDKEWIENTLSKMSLKEKCAQMIIAPVYKSFMDSNSVDYDSTIALVRDYNIGGLIMFQGELKEEINFIQKMQSLANIPLLISADYERGLGMRIDDALEFPHNMALGATMNSQLAYEMGKAIAIESRLIGVYQNFAPVADINNNALNPVINIRSFSESKFTVAEFVSSYLLGAKHGRIISTAKHFPGHGNTDIDSHTELPIIDEDKISLLQNELYPFILAINNGVQSIMIGHPVVQAYDTLPAALSKKIVTDLLINSLGFDGLIVTDALNMKAINDHYTLEETIILAVNAGNDIILMPLYPGEAVNIMYNAVMNGDIPEERIDHSVRKILSAKRWLRIDRDVNLGVGSIEDSLKKLEHTKLAQTIAEQSITLLKNDADVIPFNPSGYKNIYCLTITDGNGDETATYFQNIIERRLGNIHSILTTDKTKEIDLKKYLKTLNKSDLIIMPVFMEVKEIEGKEKLRKDQLKFIKKVLNLPAPVIILSFKNPYLLNLIPKARTYLNTYSYTDVSQTACLKALLGEIDISGRLPVSIPQTDFHIGMGTRVNKTLNTKLSYLPDSNYKFANLDSIIIHSIKEEKLSSASLIIGFNGNVIYQKKFDSSIRSRDSITTFTNEFNLSSLTAPVVITSSIMSLVDNKLISLEDKVYYYIPGFNINGKNDITIKNLLLHNSGIGRKLDSLNVNWDKEELESALINLTPEYLVGSKRFLSNLNLLLLQMIVEKVSSKSIENYINDLLFKPLGMKNTIFTTSDIVNHDDIISNNKTSQTSIFSKSEIFKKIMGGVIGFDGLQSTTNDMAIFAQLMIQYGYYDSKQYISASIVKQFVSSQLPESYAALGWQTYLSSIYVSREFSKDCYGFDSDLGSSLWIDPERNLFFILLTNSDSEKAKLLIPKLQNKIVEIIDGE